MSVPVVALVAGAVAYFFSGSKQDVLPRYAMAATSGEKEAEESTGLAKTYKATSRADSYYGKGASKETVDPSKIWDYKPPVGGYSAENNKSYTPSTSREESYYGSATPGKVPYAYAPPKGGYSADNGKTYKPTTSKADSYMGKGAAGPKPVGSYWYGADRPKWLGPLSSDSAVAPYLKGELPGDYGFDPSGFGSDPATLEKMVEAEIQHGRWAMLGALGCLAPELANKYPEITRYTTEEPVWFKAGAHIMANAGLDWDNHPGAIQSIFGHANTGNSIPVSPVIIFLSQIVFMGLAEGFRSGAITGRDQNYPGKFFDPLGMADDPAVASELKVKEIKNGRLAMLAMLAFYTQAIVTGKGPIENWFEHLDAPYAVNALTQSNISAFAPGQLM
jgi:light-harvesting complex II chlorophyll a/b binding protein 3